MAVIYNNTTVENILYNGGGVKSLNVNGINVYEKAPDYMEYLNATTISQSDFLTKVCISDTFSDINPSTNLPYAKDFIGKTITGISNTYNSSSNVDWEIIDYNHIDDPTGDNTAATYSFDLMAKKTVKASMPFYSTGSTYNQNYEFSGIRYWLQNYVNNFSTNLKNKLVTMDIVYNFNTKQPNHQGYSNSANYADSNTNATGSNKHTIPDKIKLLSGTELGYTSSISNMPYNEGSIYSNKFSSKSSTNTNSSMIRYSGSTNSAIPWWTRSRNTGSSSIYIWFVNDDGSLSTTTTANTVNIIPVIRVAVNVPEYDQYSSNDSTSISDFLNHVVNNSDVFDNNRASNFIGKTITGITNTYDSSSNVDWEIIDYNHDSTSGTFDLMAKSSIKDSVMFRARGGSSEAYTYNQNYEYSEIRTWLQSYVSNFSSTNSNLYSHLSTMDIVYNFNTSQPNNSLYSSSTGDGTTSTTGTHRHTITDKIKLLSCTELGYSRGSTIIDYMPDTEGNRYASKFSSFSANVADSNRIRNNTSGSATTWWLRSRWANSAYSYRVWYVNTDGKLDRGIISGSISVVPVIRLSV